MKSSGAVSHIRCLYEIDFSVIIPDDDDDDDRDGPRNVGFIQTPDAADSPRRFHGI